jgi:hypothetical protein
MINYEASNNFELKLRAKRTDLAAIPNAWRHHLKISRAGSIFPEDSKGKHWAHFCDCQHQEQGLSRLVVETPIEDSYSDDFSSI